MNTARHALPLSPEQVKRFSDLLLERCGLRYPENRRVELEHGIRQAFAASTCSNVDEYYQLLKAPGNAGSVAMDLLINAVTVSETHFFRDAAQFNALYEHVFPQLIERKRAIRTLRIWSAGCATGEEPYSLAILLRELIPDIDHWSITLLATDINSFSLDRARKASFSEWAFREERARRMRSAYFHKVENRYELIPEIRQMVTFQRLNLVEPRYPSYETNTTMMDLVICRNVTIYFGETITRWVVDRFYESLSDGGWLVVGHSEPSLEMYQRYQIRNFTDTVLYQRVNRPDEISTAPLGGGLLNFPSFKSPTPPPPAPDFSTSLKPGSAPLVIPPPPAVPTSKLPDLLEHATSLMDFGRTEEALRLLLDLATARPKAPSISLLVAQCYANLGNWQDAEAWCHRTIDQDKLALQAYYTLSLVLQHQGRLTEAIDAMKKVIYLDHNHIIGHYGLANLYRESGLMPQAQKSLDNALRLLQACPPEEIVPNSQGITAGRLREAIVTQQQAWNTL